MFLGVTIRNIVFNNHFKKNKENAHDHADQKSLSSQTCQMYNLTRQSVAVQLDGSSRLVKKYPL